jgi:transposase
LAELLRHGLLKASFIPPAEIRELRELTRYRQTLVKDQAAIANRIQRISESGNIKLGQVASDCLGVSGRRMLRALADGETDGEKLALLAQGRLKQKQVELAKALSGRLSSAQRFVLSELLDRYGELEAALAKVNEAIEREVAQCNDPFVREAVRLLQTIPGVGRLVAEVGDLSRSAVSSFGETQRAQESPGCRGSQYLGYCLSRANAQAELPGVRR